MPEDEDSLASEGVLSLDEVLSEVLAVVGNLSEHVVHQEGLREVEFVVGVGHGLEVESHGGTALNIADLEATSGGVAVNVEELGNVLTVLGEERVGAIGLPLLVEVHHVVGLWGEETAKLLVGEHSVEHEDLVDSGLSTLVSNTGSSHASGGEEVDLPEGSVREHHEAEASVGHQALGPHVVGAMQARADLVEVVTGAHSPFPVVSGDHVRHVLELAWVSLSLGLLSTERTKVISISYFSIKNFVVMVECDLQAQHHWEHGKVQQCQCSRRPSRRRA